MATEAFLRAQKKYRETHKEKVNSWSRNKYNNLTDEEKKKRSNQVLNNLALRKESLRLFSVYEAFL